MDIYNLCRYFMCMYTMYPYSECILLCTMFVDCLCILDMNSMYVDGDWGESPPHQPKVCSFSPHLKKLSPVDSSPNKFLSPLSPPKANSPTK